MRVCLSVCLVKLCLMKMWHIVSNLVMNTLDIHANNQVVILAKNNACILFKKRNNKKQLLLQQYSKCIPPG